MYNAPKNLPEVQGPLTSYGPRVVGARVILGHSGGFSRPSTVFMYRRTLRSLVQRGLVVFIPNQRPEVSWIRLTEAGVQVVLTEPAPEKKAYSCVVKQSKARSTGTTVSVVDNRHQEFMDDDQRWYTVCEDHSGLCGHPTRALAMAWSSEPEVWCPGCQK